MKKAPTIRDVASAAGVSVSVVSRVLNPESGPVAPAKRDMVLRVIEDLGYRPRAAARELSVGHAPTIGWWLPTWPTLSSPSWLTGLSGRRAATECRWWS